MGIKNIGNDKLGKTMVSIIAVVFLLSTCNIGALSAQEPITGTEQPEAQEVYLEGAEEAYEGMITEKNAAQSLVGTCGWVPIDPYDPDAGEEVPSPEDIAPIPDDYDLINGIELPPWYELAPIPPEDPYVPDEPEDIAPIPDDYDLINGIELPPWYELAPIPPEE